MMFAQMTAGSWVYIGSQGIVQGTYETFSEAGRQHYDGNLNGCWILSAGLGGMDGTQPLAVMMAGACALVEQANRETAQEFLEQLLEVLPYKIHTILTDNGIQFAEPPRNRNRIKRLLT